MPIGSDRIDVRALSEKPIKRSHVTSIGRIEKWMSEAGQVANQIEDHDTEGDNDADEDDPFAAGTHRQC